MDLSANYSASHTHHVEISQAEKAITLLKWTFGLVPIIAGADKSFHILTDWNKYLAPQIAHALPFSATMFMNIVGIIEIVAGILVLVKPRIGSIIVGFWLIGIAVNLLLTGQFYDVAVRDVVMAIGAFSLFILTSGRKEIQN